MAPIYEQLADAFANSKEKVIIAKVDADGQGKPLGAKYGVSGFPSMSRAHFSADEIEHVLFQPSNGSVPMARTNRTNLDVIWIVSPRCRSFNIVTISMD